MVNVSVESGAFFQTDAELAKQNEKRLKYNYTEGDAIKLGTKALALKLSFDEKYVYVAESGFFVRKISLTVSLSHGSSQKKRKEEKG
jgi:DNA-binding beta-propeller fold protein YncE